HLYRAKFLWNGVCYERLHIHNYGLTPVEVSFAFRFDADFADVFEVRGQMRLQSGLRSGPVNEDGGFAFHYRGLDGVGRRICLRATPSPARVTRSEMAFRTTLQGGQETDYFFSASCEIGDLQPQTLAYDEALSKAAGAVHTADTGDCV